MACANQAGRIAGGLIAAGSTLLAMLAIGQGPASAAACPGSVASDQFSGAKVLRKLNAKLDGFGPRPTGSPNQARFVAWIERQAERISGVRTRSLPYNVDRWEHRSSSLVIQGADVRLAGPIPFSAATEPAGVTAPVSYVAAGEKITAANSAGRIVAVEDPVETYPYSVFFPGALGVDGYQPRGLDPNAPYSRDSRNEASYIQAAQAAGAVGIVIVKDIPRTQADGFYRPYSGVRWTIPGAFAGVDEGERLRQAAANAEPATLTQDSGFVPATTRTFVATLPGAGKHPSEFLIESHTDGVNALWDNGPVAMIAMLRYFAAVPRECRPRTLEFAFTTGHLQGAFGAADLAGRLDAEYEAGGVAGVITLEHLGALEYATVPRSDGPGSALQLTRDHESTIVAVTESEALRRLVAAKIERRRLDRTALVSGTDPPVTGRVPPNCSFGGEGTHYERRLLPTIGVISGPRELFTPGYGLEAIDFGFMRAQTLAFADVLLRASRMSQAKLAGDLIEMRAQRAAGAPGCAPTAARLSFHCGLDLRPPDLARLGRRAG
jgi:hypothetical protein